MKEVILLRGPVAALIEVSNNFMAFLVTVHIVVSKSAKISRMIGRRSLVCSVIISLVKSGDDSEFYC